MAPRVPCARRLRLASPVFNHASPAPPFLATPPLQRPLLPPPSPLPPPPPISYLPITRSHTSVMSLASALASRLGALPSAHRVARNDDAASISSEGTSSARPRACSRTDHPGATDASTSLGASSTSSSFDKRSCHSEPGTSPDGPASLLRPRRNEHLAVLLPKRLWKVSGTVSITPPSISVPIAALPL